MRSRRSAEVNGDPVFDAQPTPGLVLDTGLRIVGANRAYLAATNRSVEQLLGEHILDAFPDNPEDPEADGTRRLGESLERVLRSRRGHNMVLQRYDILTGGEWVRKDWAPVNSPVVEGDQVVGVLHQVVDVTEMRSALDRTVEAYGALLDADDLEAAGVEFLESAGEFLDAAADHRALVEEVAHLRRALESRASIEQAKGIVMAEQRCSPQAAFRLLVRLSNETNVPVSAVAAALVYQTEHDVGRDRAS